MIPLELPTPNKVRSLQRTLYRKAKGNPRWRAWSLQGELVRREVLATALTAVMRNAGAAGVDGITTEEVKTNSVAFLDGLQTELRERSYRPSPVLRVWIPKPDGKQRPLGIPTVKDRVVQTALVLLLQPVFEADFHELSFGYRPKRRAQQAVNAVQKALLQKKRTVIDADLSDYFGTIPHTGLLNSIAKRVSDGAILALIKLFLKAPIVEEMNGKRRLVPNRSGVPQGGPLSPLLSNLYLNGLDHAVNENPKLGGTLVRFADDMVLLCYPEYQRNLFRRLKAYLERKGLKLNEAKTRVIDATRESFRFLGFSIGMRTSRQTKRSFTHVEPSPQARQRLRDAVRAETASWQRWRSCKETLTRVNRIARGWANYFHYGNSTNAFNCLNSWLEKRVRRWLWRKYDRTLGKHSFFTSDRIYGQYQLYKMPTTATWTR